jgi:transposase
MRGMKLIRILHDARPTSSPKHQVMLSSADRRTLRRLVVAGTASARALTHARILLKADAAPTGPGWTDDEIRTALDVSGATIVRVRRAYGHAGLTAAVHRQPPRTTRPRKLDGRQEAHLVSLACSTPPPGHARWTLRLLTDRFVELDGQGVSDETVRRLLKKTTSSRG